MSTTSTTTPTPIPTRTPITNLDAIREAYRGTLGVWTVPPAVEDQDPFDSDFREECISNTSIASDHAREAMEAAERGDLLLASDRALRACVRALLLGREWNYRLRRLYDAIRAAIGLAAIREAYWLTQGARTDGDWEVTLRASDHAREALAAAERAVLTEWGAPSERRGMVAAEHLACLALDVAARGGPESAASYSHLYHTIRGVIRNVNF